MRKLYAQIRELESEKAVYAEFLAEGKLTQEEYDEIIADLDARLKDLKAKRAGILFTTLMAAIPAVLSTDGDADDPMNVWVGGAEKSLGCSAQPAPPKP